jgi:hypothetical protein
MDIVDLEMKLKDCNSREKSHLLKSTFLKTNTSLDELYQLVKFRDPEFNHRASWVFNHIIEEQPTWLEPYIDDLITWLPTSVSSTQRDTLRSVTKYGIPNKNEGAWIDICFDFLLDPDQAVAVKVHAMEIAFRLTKKHPDLKNELLDVIDQFYEVSSYAFQARARKVRKGLEKY